MIELLDHGEDVDAPLSPVPVAIAGYRRPRQRQDCPPLAVLRSGRHREGGIYGSALLCATVLGHEEIARASLKAGVNVLSGHAQYVSPVY